MFGKIVFLAMKRFAKPNYKFFIPGSRLPINRQVILWVNPNFNEEVVKIHLLHSLNIPWTPKITHE